MRKSSLPKPDRLLTAALALMVVLGACTPAADPSTTQAISTTEPTPTTTEPDPCPDAFCIIYHIRADANWSDATPVTAADFIHTYEQRASEEGYSLITGQQALDDKTVLFAFVQPFGPWQTLFDVVLPAHVEDPLSVSAGPFVLGRAGDEVLLLRNPETQVSGEVEVIRFVAVDSVRDGLRRLASGQLDFYEPPSLDWVLDELDQMAGVEHHTASGAVWEQIAFNFDDDLLSRSWLREAILFAINREAILDATVRTISDGERGLGSAIWPDVSSLYRDAFGDSWNPEFAREVLSGSGCEPGGDDVMVCGGERLSFTFATTIGDPWRRIHFELVRDDLAAVGIELIERFLAPTELFAADFLFGGADKWQLMGFPWMFSERPHLGDSRFLCEGTAPNGFGALNVGRYCNPAVSQLVVSVMTETDPRSRRDLYWEIDQVYLDDVALIPLYQRPITIAWRDSITGPHVNLSSSTSLWNVATWTGVAEVKIGIERVPAVMNPLAPGDAALVLAPIAAGAYSNDPSLRFVPMLIESAETFVSETAGGP